VAGSFACGLQRLLAVRLPIGEQGVQEGLRQFVPGAHRPALGVAALAGLPTKCKQGQEFVIGGYKRSDKAGRAFRSLLLGTYDGDRLVYAGHVGTGFTVRDAHELLDRMEALRSEEPTIEDVPRPDRRHVVWVKPKLVAEIQFTERTPDGELRHPSFKGLRMDKPAKGVRLEFASTTVAVQTVAGQAADAAAAAAAAAAASKAG
jgi:bifunctional non-homologous end joining protein LigD